MPLGAFQIAPLQRDDSKYLVRRKIGRTFLQSLRGEPPRGCEITARQSSLCRLQPGSGQFSALVCKAEKAGSNAGNIPAATCLYAI